MRLNRTMVTIGIAVLLAVTLAMAYRGCASESAPQQVGQNQAKQEAPAHPVAQAPEEGFPWKVAICLVLGIILLAASAVHRPAPRGQWEARRPPAWAFAFFLGLPLALWLIWVISPTVYMGIANNHFFWPIVFAAGLAAFLESQTGRSAHIMSTVLTVLVFLALFFAIGSAFYSPTSEKKPAETAGANPTAPPTPLPTEAKVTHEEPCYWLREDQTPLLIDLAPGKWSTTYCLPSGLRVNWEGTAPDSTFKVKTQTGKEYSFTPEKSDKLPYPESEFIRSVTFIAIGDKPQQVKMTLFGGERQSAPPEAPVPLFRPLVPKKEPKEEPRPKLARPSTP